MIAGFALVLGVTADELIGLKPAKSDVKNPA
jgi:hypothetical protein